VNKTSTELLADATLGSNPISNSIGAIINPPPIPSNPAAVPPIKAISV